MHIYKIIEDGELSEVTWRVAAVRTWCDAVVPSRSSIILHDSCRFLKDKYDSWTGLVPTAWLLGHHSRLIRSVRFNPHICQDCLHEYMNENTNQTS